MQDATTPASPLGRLVHGAARATSLFSSLLDQDVQRRHDLLMKHGHPLPGNSIPTLIRCAAVITVALIAVAAAVTDADSPDSAAEASAKQTTPTPAAEKPGPPTQPRTRCCDLPRHRSAPPSPATGITGRGHMPHRPPVQRSLPRADTRPGPSPEPTPRPGAITPTSRPRRISAHLFEQDPPPGAAQSDTDTDTDHLDTGDNTDGADQADTEGADPDDSDADGHLSTPGIHQDGADSDAIAVAAAVTDADNPDSAAEASAKQTTPTPAAEKPGPPTQPRTRCCDLPRHRSAPPSPATGITGRGHMPHRPPVQRSLPRADTRSGPSPEPTPRPRSPFHHRAETSSLLGHPGPTPEGVSPETQGRPLSPTHTPGRSPWRPLTPPFLAPQKGKIQGLLQTLKNRAKSGRKNHCKNL